MNLCLSNKFLIVGGSANIFIAILHVAMLFIGSSAYQYFGAPPDIVNSPYAPSSIVIVILLIIFFFTIGVYALSAVGLTRRLPGTKFILSIVGIIYTLRGSVIIFLLYPQYFAHILTLYPNLLYQGRSWMPQDWFFSAVALFIGICYLIGAFTQNVRQASNQEG